MLTDEDGAENGEPPQLDIFLALVQLVVIVRRWLCGCPARSRSRARAQGWVRGACEATQAH